MRVNAFIHFFRTSVVRFDGRLDQTVLPLLLIVAFVSFRRNISFSEMVINQRLKWLMVNLSIDPLNSIIKLP